MDNQKWLDFYQKDKSNTRRVFVKVMLDDEKHFFFHEYNDWFAVKDYCDKNKRRIAEIQLQFRSNCQKIDLSGADGVYLVRSVMGSPGMESKNYLTVGVLKGDEVHKCMYLVPELIVDKQYTDTLSQCFEEATICYEKETEDRKKQVQA